jgi:uncharacterized caspase-like protein
MQNYKCSGFFIAGVFALLCAVGVSSAQAQQANKNTAKLQPTSEQDEPNSVVSSGEIKIALIIGNTNYDNLPKLTNSTNDARAVAETFRKMGYRTQLLLDASDQSLRRAVRKFTNESDKAEIAVVFYAGHGAQVYNNNYVLPVDMDIPDTESDIQFAGLKIDDLINSIRSRTKIIFLDACRDDPLLYKNIVKGRGSFPRGLAPAIGSNFEQAKAGGGIFVAYATEAGSVAEDGKGQHSPFTDALLRNLENPISIDDMFSIVTREVRLATKNAQRPYKYASLENVICLTATCSNSSISAATDLVQLAKQNESGGLLRALQPNKDKILSEFSEWVLTTVYADYIGASYIRLSSIQVFGDRTSVLSRRTLSEEERKKDKLITGQTFSDGAYLDDVKVFDCKKHLQGSSENTILNKMEKMQWHYKWADPRFLAIDDDTDKIQPGSSNQIIENILCNEQNRVPLVSKKQLSDMNFKSLSSTYEGDGDMFFEPLENSNEKRGGKEKETLLVIKYAKDNTVKYLFSDKVTFPNFPIFRTIVERVKFKCNEKKYIEVKSEYYDSSNKLGYIRTVDSSIESNWTDFEAKTPYALLQRIICVSDEADK